MKLFNSGIFKGNMIITENSPDKTYVQIVKGSNKIVAVPNYVSNDLAYIVAAIICDGHLKKDKFRIVFENTNEETMKKFVQKMNDLFEINAKYTIVRDKREYRKIRFRAEITSKPIFLLFNNIFEIPRGKKSDKVKVPVIIKKSSGRIKLSFLEGVFDTDGGSRHGTIGLTSASKEFRDDLVSILHKMGFTVYSDEWLNKVYDKKFYGFYIKKVRGDTQAVKGTRFRKKGHA
jgi:intein/homing endonuclease